MKYVFDKEARSTFEKYLGALAEEDEIAVGDFEAEPDAFFWETGSGNNKASVHINQTTGKLVFKYDLPNSKKNDWCEHEENIEHRLKKHVIKKQGGGRRKTRRATKKRARN
jgi:hypothetical protein